MTASWEVSPGDQANLLTVGQFEHVTIGVADHAHVPDGWSVIGWVESQAALISSARRRRIDLRAARHPHAEVCDTTEHMGHRRLDQDDSKRAGVIGEPHHDGLGVRVLPSVHHLETAVPAVERSTAVRICDGQRHMCQPSVHRYPSRRLSRSSYFLAEGTEPGLDISEVGVMVAHHPEPLARPRHITDTLVQVSQDVGPAQVALL